MTDTKKNNSKVVSDNRISTHPSYKEYSWDSLVGGEKKNAEASSKATPTADAAKAVPLKKGIHTSGIKSARKAKKETAVKKEADAIVKKEAEAAVAVPAAKVKVKKKVQIHTIASGQRYAFPLAIVLLSLCFTLLIVAIVTTAVQINEITQENSKLEINYNSLVSHENELRLRLETRDDLRLVEQMAKEELGMVKVDQVERYYLTVHQEDKIEIIEEEESKNTGIFDSISDFGNSIVERLRRFFGM